MTNTHPSSSDNVRSARRGCTPARGDDDAGHKRLIYVVTIAATANFLRGQLRYMQSRGFEVTLIASPDPLLRALAETEGVAVRSVVMARSISLPSDLLSLWLLVRTFRELRPHVVNVGTPKAGLLAGVAAVICRVPLRVYTLHGLRLEGATGMKRWLLTATEWIACRSAHLVVCVSGSLRDRATAMRLVARSRAVLVGHGSCNGVDTHHFRPAQPSEVAQLRTRLGIDPDAPVIGYAGRLARDKGIAELSGAYAQLRRRRPGLRLLIIGEDDDTDPLDADVRAAVERDEGVVRTGWVADTAPYYHCMNVFVLPTYREGLPQTALEAAASQVPVVTTDATGARDAVVDNVTGLRVPRRDRDALAAALARVLDNPDLADQFGRHGRNWVSHAFAPAPLWSDLARLYGADPGRSYDDRTARMPRRTVRIHRSPWNAKRRTPS
jgi:glycosyltransferase involved in cell wall biosynthesis